MKKNLISIVKTALKHFFDIDPVITEHMILQTATGAQLISQEVQHTLLTNVQQGKTRIIRLLHPEMEHHWNAA